MLKIVLIAGSSRTDSQSAKVAGYLQERLINLKHTEATLSTVVDLGASPLPMWPSNDTSAWTSIQPKLASADAVVVIAPEWHGMACPAIKNFFLYASKNELAHKPGLLVGVSSGIGGAYPISELRASSYKNCRLCYLPEHLIIRQVESVFNSPSAANADDQRIRDRADYALDILARYALALESVRVAISFSNPDFANGM